MKLTDKKRDVIELSKKALANGKNYKQIAAELAKLGFVNSRGKPVSNVDLSYFLLNFAGVRQHTKKAASMRKECGTSGASRGPLRKIEDIITSNISDNLKAELISLVVKARG